MTAATDTDFAFTITRSFDAPRELVWKAFTEPDRLVHWWGPKGFTTVSCDVDLRPGGLFRYRLRAPDGTEMRGQFVYREIVAPERLEFLVSFTDANGNVTRHPWSPDWPLQILSTVTFAERDGRTEVTITWVAHEATDIERKTFEEGRDSMREGWTGTFERLEAYLAGTR